MRKPLAEIYNGFAQTYEQNRGLFDMKDLLERFYDDLEVEKGILLDLGCGAGEPFGRFFVDRNWRVTGVDFSDRMLEMAARYVPEMKTVCADMRDVDFAPGSFDAITAIYSLFHVPKADHPALFEKMRRWLNPTGKVLFTYATKEYTGSDEFDGYKEFMGEQLYYSHTTPEALYEDVRNAGFTISSSDYRDIGGETFLWVTADG
ncbi:MAG TPA: class I SAM-dependent methyltransferase [Deltaproteobacteria bacterium]|nr:class I SAM-dependent methyltransferase [Deltaproteobacteria bacterium]